MLAYTFYENDGRVMRYAEALVGAGAQVDAITLRREGQSAQEWINGVQVFRIQQRERNERGKLRYLLRILKFFFLSMAHITARHARAPYDVVHVHSVPDFEVFAACVPKLLGAKIILDIHDIVPEFYAAKFGIRDDSLVVRALKLVERLSARFADHVIIANDLWLEKITRRSVDRAKCSSFINYPDLNLFNPSLRSHRPASPFVFIYPGTLNWHQGLDIAIKAFSVAVQPAPDMQLHIYGEGSSKAELQQMVLALDLGDKVAIRAPLPQKQIAAVMANADLGIVPKRNDSFGGDAFSTKILEFMALGVPVLAAATRVDRHYFNDTLVHFFTPGDADALASAMLSAYRDRATNARRAARALEHAKHQAWSVKSRDYLALVERLVNAGA